MDQQVKRLRDLPGVAEIEAMCKSPSYFDDQHIRETMAKIDAVSISLFSISYYLTSFDCFEWSDDEDNPTREQWEALLSLAMKPYAETRQFWEAWRWDITDGNGNELECAHYFAEQIIIAESDLIDGVQLTPDGSGKDAFEGPELSEEELAERLEQEVREFLLRRH